HSQDRYYFLESTPLPVELTARDVVGPMRLVTRSRDIKIQQFTESLELETERGDIQLTPGHVPLPAIDARSGAGKIELLLPDKAAFQLEATAKMGDAVNDFGPPKLPPRPPCPQGA